MGFWCSCHLCSLSYWDVIEVTLLPPKLMQLLANSKPGCDTIANRSCLYSGLIKKRKPPLFSISHRCNEQALILMMVMGHVLTSFWSFPNVGAGKDMIKSAFKAGDRIVPTTLLKSPVRLYTLIRQLKWQTHIKDINRQMSGSFPANRVSLLSLWRG